jgi:ACT domain-containing protein
MIDPYSRYQTQASLLHYGKVSSVCRSGSKAVGKANRTKAGESSMSRNQAKDKRKLIEKLRKMPIIEAACKQVGLPRATYYRWRQNDPDFARECDEAIEQSAALINDLAESQLINAIKQQNLSAITFWLKHHHPVYENRLRLDGRIGYEIESLTPEQEQLVAKALSMVGLVDLSINTKESSNETE